MWRVLYKIRARNRATDTIQWLFRRAKEESKIKQAAIRFSLTLRSLAHRARYYLANKRARVEMMAKRWSQVLLALEQNTNSKQI